MSGPLAGVRVLELAGIGPGPFAAMLLADLGADVVRVDRPEPGALSAGDPRRDLLNRGKRSVVVDLKHPDGAEVVLGLADRAAIVIEGWRPGVAERLGIGPQAALERNPGLVYGRMTGWGQQGPLARAAGHDIGYIAVAGALHPIGRPGGPPQIPLNLVGDFGGGALYLVVGCLAALHVAGTTGRGQVVDAAIVDGTAHLTTMFAGLLADGAWQPERGRNLLDGGAPFYDVYATADGGHMAVGALEPQFYAELLRLLGLADADLPAQHDVAGWPVLRARFAEVFAGRTRDEWTTVFEGTDACVAPVLSLAEAQRHPHLVARATFEEHFGLRQPAVAPRLSRTPGVIGGSPPVPGADTETVLTEWGLAAHLRQWLDNGAVSQTQGAR
ncbi:carnitine dehydratase [Micromonospora echinospora]|uniref:Alpha-methylacyl-CoA racemase n=1 Tax=Micromonospora echinospora TaxID=1877 RepID=A0A1C4ZKG2_MICEC|nr:CaiB/BaiF CoA-transferase family protein [Micromonospora echinospora]OZV81513.1 carnitine dehydratase [Micromonospora echinospora]SCF33379.1 alpha-methylacyl-CoA racemase [Micromonospora echinospora]